LLFQTIAFYLHIFIFFVNNTNNKFYYLLYIVSIGL